MSVGAHFSVNITMGSHGVKGHTYKFTWQTQAVMLSSLSFIPVLFSISWGNVGADGSLCFRAVEYAWDDHQHDLCKSVCAHLERKVHTKSLNCIGTVHRGERSVFTCWCVVKLEKNLYQVRKGVKQRITTRCELTALGSKISSVHVILWTRSFPCEQWLLLLEMPSNGLRFDFKLLFCIQWNWMLTMDIKQDCLWIMTSYESGPHTEIYCNMTSYDFKYSAWVLWTAFILLVWSFVLF